MDNDDRGRNARFDRRRFLMSVAAGAGLCALPGTALAHHPFKFGLTPVFLDSDIQLIQDMTSYFSKQAGHPVTLVKRRTYQEITSLMLSGGLDAAWICGFPYVQYRERLRLLAAPLYKGKPLYQSYLIAHRDTPANAIADLRGTRHAFSDPNSNSGYLVTLHRLVQLGATPQSFFSETMFTYGHRNVIRAVSSGLAQSGSVDGYVWDVVSEMEPNLVAKAHVVEKSELMGFPPIACPADLADEGLINELQKALLDMHNDPLGRKILSTLHLDGFQKVEPSLYGSIAKNYLEVKDLL